MFSALIVSCGGSADDTTSDTSIEVVDSLAESNCDKPNCDRPNCDKADCDKICDKKCDKSVDCEKKNCDKFGCEEAGACTPECLADCMANCENPDKCMKMCEKDSTEAACDGAE